LRYPLDHFVGAPGLRPWSSEARAPQVISRQAPQRTILLDCRDLIVLG